MQSRQNSELIDLLKNAYDLMKNGAFGDAGDLLENALSLDFENPEVICALKCSSYWSAREKQYGEISDPFERGEFLIKQWKSFLTFLQRDGNNFEQGKYSLKQWVFSQALHDFIVLLEGPAAGDPEILFRIGRCYKGKGNYKKALEYLEACNHQKADDPRIIAELADCYAFINETQAAKIFFREAFFIDPQKIEIESLESMMIVRLIGKLREMDLEGVALAEWLPVYGVLFGVFNVKRELRSLEYGRLRQSIFTLQSKFSDEGKKDIETEPRLLNRYFWLIDHYISSGDSREKVNEVLHKIRAINPSIYEHYTQ
jgi:tetratricopeptide (TPR) repeat protein